MQPLHDKETVTMLVLGRLHEFERKVNARTHGRIQSLQIESTGDCVVLSGQTRTYYAKQLATQLALEEFGEIPLNNQIEVN